MGERDAARTSLVARAKWRRFTENCVLWRRESRPQWATIDRRGIIHQAPIYRGRGERLA